MTDPELQELADLWQEPGRAEHAEQADFEVLARKARRQARLMAYGDIAWLVLIAGSMVIATLLHPSLFSFLAGILTLAVMFWLNWRRRSLRRQSQMIDTHDRFAFLASSVRLANGNVRRLTLNLIAIPPTLLLAILFRVVTKDGGSVARPIGPIMAWATSTRGVIAVILLVGISIWGLRSLKREKAKLRQLEELHRAYEEEARRDELDGA